MPLILVFSQKGRLEAAARLATPIFTANEISLGVYFNFIVFLHAARRAAAAAPLLLEQRWLFFYITAFPPPSGTPPQSRFLVVCA